MSTPIRDILEDLRDAESIIGDAARRLTNKGHIELAKILAEAHARIIAVIKALSSEL